LQADLVINEVMANESGSDVTLEWIELYNNSDSLKTLSNYTLEVNGQMLPLPTDVISGGDYYVLCRRLASSGSTPGFEAVWGNNTGVWGDDSERETYRVYQLASLTLPNDTGQILLRRLSSTTSSFVWNQAGADGISWERFSPTLTVVGNSVDSRGSTPGEINSITPRRFDLSIVSLQSHTAAGGKTLVSSVIANSGTSVITLADLNLYYDLNRDSVVIDEDLITTYSLFSLSPYDTVLFEDILTLEGIYPSILAKLPDDDRETNNLKLITATGNQYPPVIITEFMPYPRPPLNTEWVEIQNHSDTAINISGWKIGDSLRLNVFSSSSHVMEPGDFLVLVQDSIALRDFYNDNQVALLEPPGWAELNNGGDRVRLYDSLNNPADSFTYFSAYDDNYTWGRGNEPGMTDLWGRSVDIGGTPGSENVIFYQAAGSEIMISIEPNPFSPSRDRETAITFSMPPGEVMTIRIYDREGRVVKTILDNMPALSGTIYWDGTDDKGARLHAGIYILYAEVPDIAHYKRTVVIAP